MLKSKSTGIKDDFLQKENELYNCGKWDEARQLLRRYRKEDITPIQESEHQRLLGWCCYYLGKKNLEDKVTIGNEARKAFIKVLLLSQVFEDVDSALNALPLVYYYLLSEPNKAIRVSEKAVEKANNKGQALNTQGILYMEEKLVIKALTVFSEAYRASTKLGDYLTSGHALNNKARTLILMLPVMTNKKNLLEEIRLLLIKRL